jgi:acyl-homoserine lactone acylase PvdQ
MFENCKTYSSVPINLILADTSGNIGYALLAGGPIRNNSFPYLGQRVLDGQVTTHDWLGNIEFKEQPWVINPAKGYIVTAN